jgi:hypothetical protein
VTNNSEGNATGAVYIFDVAAVGGLVRTEIQMLQPDAITGGDQFGASVSMTEDLLAVGAPGVFPNGEVYLFERPVGDWEVGGRIIPDLGPGSNLCQAGVGSAVYGRTAAAGCPEGASDPMVLAHDGNGIFADGFETGDVSKWSSAVP